MNGLVVTAIGDLNGRNLVGATMDGLAIHLENSPGALAKMGEVLGAAGARIEGAGAFINDQTTLAHSLFSNGEAACGALEAAGIRVGACDEA